MKRYEQAKADYELLREHHNADCNDLTGAYVADEEYFELLENPSKKNAYRHYCNLISHYANAGYEPDDHGNKGGQPDFCDEKVCDVFRRNCDELVILSSWGVDISEPDKD